MKANYHTHTYRCFHASGREEDYILKAIQYGHREIGFADHSPWQYDSSYKSGMRMSVSQLEGYVKTLRELREKYADQISVKIGLECEYFPKYMNWLKQTLADYSIDYIILGNHYQKSDEYGLYYGYPTKDKRILVSYVDDVVEAIHTGLYSYVAHPDLIHYKNQSSEEYKQEMTRLCQAAKELNIPLEFNLLGYSTHRQYPCDDFWQIAAKIKNKAILGIDAHDLFQYDDQKSIEQAEKYLQNLGIEITEEIKFLR